MNRKQKIIVSVTGIFVVLLILVGLTYAYFLTRINGNTNTKSISVGTKYLEVTYIDGNNEIATANSIEPSSNAIITKEFSVRNDGDTTNYAVIIENISIIDKDNNDTTFTYPDDLTYELICTNSDTTSCGSTTGVFPSSSKGIYYVTIDEGITQSYELKIYYNESGIDQSADMGKTFSAKINISEPATTNPYKTEQNTLKYHILNNSILNLNGTPLLSTPTTNPAHEIYYSNNSYKTKGEESTISNTFTVSGSNKSKWWAYGTDYEVSETTGDITLLDIKVCQYNDTNCITKLVNTDNKSVYVQYVKGYNTRSIALRNLTNSGSYIFKITNIETGTDDILTYKQINSMPTFVEREMSYTEDEKGTSYYFRGDVKDNYVNFADKCWRIVRIDGDGNTRLILEDKNTTCDNISYTGNWKIGTGTYGYDNSDNTNYYFDYDGCTSDSSTCQRVKMQTWYTTNLLSKQSYLSDESINTGDNTVKYDDYGNVVENNNNYYFYDSFNRLSLLENSNLNISGITTSQLYIFPITADEAAHAGGAAAAYNDKYYLINDYLKENYVYFWTASIAAFSYSEDSAFFIDSQGFLNINSINYDSAIRPMISLKSSTVYNGGNGTKNNPYIIDVE